VVAGYAWAVASELQQLDRGVGLPFEQLYRSR